MIVWSRNVEKVKFISNFYMQKLHYANFCISRTENSKSKKTVGVITECELSKPLNFQYFRITNTSLKKLSKRLAKYLEILSSSDNSSEVEVISEGLEARTIGTVEVKTKTIYSIPSKYSVEIYPPVYPTNVIMSVIKRVQEVRMLTRTL